MAERLAVLFVCMGNICRSPAAEAVFRRRVEEAGLTARIAVDSAGTGGWHAGDAPDRRMQRSARARGYHLGDLRARQLRPDDCHRFDWIVAMDDDNLRHLERHCPGHPRLELLMSFAPERPEREVPDPYYGGSSGFDRVLDMIETATAGLFERVTAELGPSEQEA